MQIQPQNLTMTLSPMQRKISGGGVDTNLVLISIARLLRTVGFGAVSVVLALFMIKRGFTNVEVGLLLSGTLLTDALFTTVASSFANKLGLRNMLYLSCATIVIGGLILSYAQDNWMIAAAVVLGIVSPSGFEGGPFAPLEQAIVAKSTHGRKLISAFSWYNMVGFGGAALGALLAGICAAHSNAESAYQTIFLAYAFGGIALAVLYSFVDVRHLKAPKESIEHPYQESTSAVASNADLTSTDRSKHYALRLAALQSLDAFGGGFIVQSILTLWFCIRYHVDAAFLGPIYFWCNLIAAVSFAMAPRIVSKLGLLNTMVFTHLPCSLALCILPLLPSAEWAAALLLSRSAFSSMDIPVRQTFAMLIVSDHLKPFAAGITTSARSVSQALAPALTGLLMSNVASGLPVVLAGLFKAAYDIGLYVSFKSVPVREHSMPR